MRRLSFEILGTPTPKQADRSRVAGKGRGSFIQHYQPQSVKQAGRNLRAQLIDQLPADFTPLEGPLVVEELVFTFPPIKSLKKPQRDQLARDGEIPKDTKPDLDNLEKLLWDACEGVLFMNDARLVEKRQVRKVYGARPGIRFAIAEAGASVPREEQLELLKEAG